MNESYTGSQWESRAPSQLPSQSLGWRLSATTQASPESNRAKLRNVDAPSRPYPGFKWRSLHDIQDTPENSQPSQPVQGSNVLFRPELQVLQEAAKQENELKRFEILRDGIELIPRMLTEIREKLCEREMPYDTIQRLLGRLYDEVDVIKKFCEKLRGDIKEVMGSAEEQKKFDSSFRCAYENELKTIQHELQGIAKNSLTSQQAARSKFESVIQDLIEKQGKIEHVVSFMREDYLRVKDEIAELKDGMTQLTTACLTTSKEVMGVVTEILNYGAALHAIAERDSPQKNPDILVKNINNGKAKEMPVVDNREGEHCEIKAQLSIPKQEATISERHDRLDESSDAGEKDETLENKGGNEWWGA